jgi:hypothetical protein
MIARIRSSMSSPDQACISSVDEIPQGSQVLIASKSFNTKRTKLSQILRNAQVDVSALREVTWSGCQQGDPSLRALSWKILLGYLPTRTDRQEEFICRKRREYAILVEEFNHVFSGDLSGVDDNIAVALRQIRLDIPRTYTGTELLSLLEDKRICGILERVLFLFAQRNVACGYVQGQNDLAIQIIALLLMASTGTEQPEIKADMTDEELFAIECDAYFMFSRLLQV